jgi:hypothetical protein
MSKFTKIAEQLAEQYVTRQEKWAAWTDAIRPENKDRPGINWYSGIGAGALAAGHELYRGADSVTNRVLDFFGRQAHIYNPTNAITEAVSGADKNPLRRVIADTLRGAVQAESRTLGGRGIGDVSDLTRRLHGRLNFNDSASVSDLANRFYNLSDNPSSLRDAVTATANPIDLKTNQRIKDLAQQFFDGTSSWNSFSDRQVRDIASDLHNYTHNGATLNPVSDEQLVKELTDILKVKKQVPTIPARLRRAGTVGGLTAVGGGYLLPALIAKMRRSRQDQ